MAITTRSRTSSPTKKPVKDQAPIDNEQFKASLKHFVLPRDLSDRSRFLILNHPRSLTPERFLFCPERGLFQFTRLSSPDPHSILFAASNHVAEANTDKDGLSKGHISRVAETFVAAPFDIAFLLLALLAPSSSKSQKSLFQPIDDILEQHLQESRHLRYLVTHGQRLVNEAMTKFCDSIEAGDEQMYRLNEGKILQMIMHKVGAVIAHGLPAGLEDKFVKRKLEVPLLSVKREDTNLSVKSVIKSQNDPDSASESFDSQSTAVSSAPSAVFSEDSVSSSTTTVCGESVADTLYDLQKQSVILDFILTSYVPQAVADRLRNNVSSASSPINLAPLNQHLKHIATLKAEAAASRSVGDYSRKRGLDDEEAAELREEKRRKQEEEEKKKRAGESRGVRDLKKVNVTGMKKMSDFFSKKPAAQVKG